MSEVTRLIVVRHGNTFNTGDVICRVGSATDIPLTETGMKQAYAAGEMLAENGFVPDVIFHAPLQRTCQSAVGLCTRRQNAQNFCYFFQKTSPFFVLFS